MRLSLVALLALTSGLALSACDSNDPADGGVTATLRASQVPADTTVMAGNRPMAATNRYTLYNLRDNKVVLSYKESDKAKRAADSVSTKWDIGFSSESVIVNRTAGSQAQALVATTAFEALTEAPATGYGTAVLVSGSVAAPGGSALWTYTPKTDVGTGARWGMLTPTPGRTLVVRTAGGDYAKIKFVSYYKGAPDPADVTIRTTLNFVTFDYVLQRDGTRSFQ